MSEWTMLKIWTRHREPRAADCTVIDAANDVNAAVAWVHGKSNFAFRQIARRQNAARNRVYWCNGSKYGHWGLRPLWTPSSGHCRLRLVLNLNWFFWLLSLQDVVCMFYCGWGTFWLSERQQNTYLHRLVSKNSFKPSSRQPLSTFSCLECIKIW